MQDDPRFALSPAEVLADRLHWMHERQGRDPMEMLNRQIALGQMTGKQAEAVAALVRASDWWVAP